MVATVLLYVLACLGLTIQFGYAGVLNFAAPRSSASAATPRPC